MADTSGGKTDARGVKRGREDGAAAASSPPLGSPPLPVPPFLLGGPLLGGGAGLGGGGGFWVWVPGPMLGGGGGGPYPHPLPPSSFPPIPLAPPPPAPRPAAPSPALSVVGAASTTVSSSSSSSPSLPPQETPAPLSRGAGAAERAPKSARVRAPWTSGAPRWAATKEEARGLLDGAENGTLAVYEGGAGRGPIHFLRWSSGTYYLHSASRSALEPGKKGMTNWSRATVLERSHSLGYVVEEKVEGEWIEVDLEAGTDDERDEDDDDMESPFDAAPEGSLAIFEGGDDDPVHILRLRLGKRGQYRISKSARPALQPGAKGRTQWSRATVLELARARGYAVEQKAGEKWVALELEGAAEGEGAEETG
jgi:hypothetical protein